MDEQRRVLDMVAAGQLTPDEANDLLNALNSTEMTNTPRAQRPAKLLKIMVDTEDEEHTHINLPLSLAKFTTRFIPQEAHEALKFKGLDLSGLLNALENSVPEGRLVDVSAEMHGRQVRVLIEVV